MSTVNVTTVVGARPQFIKAAAVSRAIADLNRAAGEPRLRERIVHTGQHYDPGMSQVFFDEIGIPPPAVNLDVGSGSHGHQTGRMLEGLEQDLVASRPDRVLIYGDTNSTLAGALASAKLHIPVAHVEAGLRSYNRRMPEEINRVVADCLSTLLFCPTRVAVENLAKEGITQGVHRVGDVMYDSVLFHASQAERRSDVMARLGLKPKSFYLATVHRAENTDDPERLSAILASFAQIRVPVVIPMHPRTRKTLGAQAGRARLAATRVGGEVRVIDPVPYLDMLALERNARIILTDSGGVQKEAYWFGVPCVTLRDETEWIELVEAGCNRVVGADPKAIGRAVADFEAAGASLPPDRPADLYGDGHGAEKIVALLGARP
jgi:UDP-N-acetylglucosamine 2-epimerase